MTCLTCSSDIVLTSLPLIASRRSPTLRPTVSHAIQCDCVSRNTITFFAIFSLWLFCQFVISLYPQRLLANIGRFILVFGKKALIILQVLIVFFKFQVLCFTKSNCCE